MDRIALVIGNSDYSNVGKLNNPKNDADDIASILNKLNFDVTKIMDANLIDIQKSVNDFLQALDEYAVGVFFYAGHGMQIDGKNFIVPIDLKLSDKSKTMVSCYCLNSLLEGASSYKGKTLICILDACRDNPFAMGRGFLTGFAPFNNPPKGTMIAYSTSADCSAFDGQCSNGLYTQVLKDAMLIPNLKIEEMFKFVRNKVSEISISQYGEEQLSWEYSSLVGDFYFSVTPQPVNEQVTDEKIYEFICARRKSYENASDNIYDIECLPYIDAYNKYHIPIIKILRAYSRVDYSKRGFQFSDATIDQLNSNYLSSWGFIQKYGRWYYKNHYVEMGDLLPLPEELEPKQPINGKELKIEASLSWKMNDGKIRFQVSSNIPEETPLMFTLRGKEYTAQCKSVAGNRISISEWFSDRGNPMKNGFYTIDVSCPIYSVLPEKIKKIFGERNRNICGQYVKFEPVGGNTIHTDKQHIHCHIYYNSTTLDCTRKFRNFWGSSFALRRLSDRLCLENGLSIVENPKPRSKSKYRNYGEWQKDRKGPLSYQDRLRLAIDTALAERPADLDEFLNLMKRAGYEVKTVRGGGISFRLTGQGQERFTRLRASTLGDGYDLQDVLSAIEGKEKRPGRSERKISLAVDIQAKLAAGKGPGYERWAKVFNIKQMAAALAYIQDNNLTDYEQLAKKATEAADRFHVISEQVKQTEQAMKTNAGLKAATVQYAKTRPVFEQYKATKYSRKFLAEHEADLELYRAAQAEMRSLLGGAKLPKMDVLKEEGRKLTAKKKQLYGEYQKARRDMQEIVTIKANIDTLMGYTEPGRKQEKER